MLRPSNRLFTFASVLALTGLVACSSSSDGGTGTTADGGAGDGGGTGDGGGGGGGDGGKVDSGGGDGGGDGGLTPVNACNTFVDLSAAAANRTLTWDFAIAQAPERCAIVKKGQDVTFKGDFAVHPLNASGGQTPNPISTVDATGKVTFTAAGTFGFQCGFHPSMTGAIRVIE